MIKFIVILFLAMIVFLISPTLFLILFFLFAAILIAGFLGIFCG